MPPSIENRIRSSLSVIRFMQSFMPFRFSSQLLKKSVSHVRLPAGVSREKFLADGVSCDWIIPENNQPGKVLLYLHGGGFVFGQTPLHLQMGAWLARRMNVRVLMVDYRLAPDHPFPAALDDCVAAYQWLLKQGYSHQGIAIAGDSAGGNLALTTMLKLRDSGIPLPAAAACLSPVTDLTEKASRPNGFKDPLLPSKAVGYYTKSYLGGHDARDPLVSPVFGDLHRLPPLLVHAGEQEILREDAVRIVEWAKACGVDARLEIFPRMWHVWQLFLSLPDAVRSLESISQFLGSKL